MKRFYGTTEVLRITEISRDTLFRWMRQGLIKRPRRNGRGYLFWSKGQLTELRKFIKDRYTPK